jgi:hypothetical protein
MSRPSRATTSGRAYLDLLARARHEGRPADELLTLYVLERFLYRVSVSAHRDRLVLKGGMLLSVCSANDALPATSTCSPLQFPMNPHRSPR